MVLHVVVRQGLTTQPQLPAAQFPLPGRFGYFRVLDYRTLKFEKGDT
jgi:hypothetical protein